MSARYALYYAPEPSSALWRFGSAVLGYDAATGEAIEALTPEGVTADDWTSMTNDPRRYGFHATLKAPFHLASGVDEVDLVVALARFAEKQATVALGTCSIEVVEGAFVALIPRRAPAELAALEQAVVTGFDAFRAPLTEADRSRRNLNALSPRQRQQLEQWGYPYVLDDFRFHMTLSGRLAAPAPIAASLQGLWAARQDTPDLSIDRIALFRQMPGERFRIIAVAPLQAQTADLSA